MLCLLGEELAQGESIPAQPHGVFVVGKHAGKLVPEGRHTARLEPNNGNTFPDVGTQVLHKPLEEDLRGVEHAVVEEWAPAAEWLLRHDHPVAGVLQHLGSGLRRLGVEVVVEGVGEKDYWRAPRISGAALLVPGFEGLRGKGWHLALGGEAGSLLDQLFQSRRARG